LLGTVATEITHSLQALLKEYSSSPIDTLFKHYTHCKSLFPSFQGPNLEYIHQKLKWAHVFNKHVVDPDLENSPTQDSSLSLPNRRFTV
jgi:hypothetical protein